MPSPSAVSTTSSVPRLLIRLEGALAFVLSYLAYLDLGGNPWLFLLLFLAPDLLMMGFTVNTRIGALVYNTGHTYLAPFACIGITGVAGWPFGILFGLIWAAHIGFDRLLGYGLKYPTGFQDTHIQRL